jgi:hypothetical protein
MPLGLSQGIVTFMLERRSITTGVKPDGMHGMPLGLLRLSHPERDISERRLPIDLLPSYVGTYLVRSNL